MSKFNQQDQERFIREVTTHSGKQIALRALIDHHADEDRLDFLIINKEFLGKMLQEYLELADQKLRDDFFPKIKEAVAEAKELQALTSESTEFSSLVEEKLTENEGKIPTDIFAGAKNKITELKNAVKEKSKTVITDALQALKIENAKIDEHINLEKSNFATANTNAGRALTAAKKIVNNHGKKIPGDIKALLETKIQDLEKAKNGEDRGAIETATESLKEQTSVAEESIKNPVQSTEPAVLIHPSYDGNPHTKNMILQSILNQLSFNGKNFVDVVEEIRSRYDTLMLEFKGIQFVLFHIVDPEEQQLISSAGLMEGFRPLFEPGKFFIAESEIEEKPKLTRQTQLLIDLFGLRFWNTAFPSLSAIPEQQVCATFKEKVIAETKKSLTRTIFNVSEEGLKEAEDGYDAAMYEFCIAILQKL